MKTKKLFPLILTMIFILTACGSFKEGTYTCEAVGHNQEGKIEVTVEVDSEGQIKSIETKHEDTPEIADPAIDQLSKDMIENNTYKVDHIAGATYTSRGFEEAVEDALTDTDEN